MSGSEILHFLRFMVGGHGEDGCSDQPDNRFAHEDDRIEFPDRGLAPPLTAALGWGGGF